MKFYTSVREAFEALGLALPPELEPVEARFPVYLNEYYLKLIDPADWKNDPIARQALPAPAELADESSSFDPLAEEEQKWHDGEKTFISARMVDGKAATSKRVHRKARFSGATSMARFMQRSSRC